VTPGGAVLLAVAVAALAPTAASAQQFRLLELPGVEALPMVPPLAPPQPPITEAPRLRGSVLARERVVVGMAPDGTPRTVTVSQRLLVRALGDYAFFVPAPAIRVVAGPGSQSRPGFRPNQIVWQGFSPRRKVLVAVAELRPGGSVPALPVRVRVTGVPVRPGPFELTISLENATRTRATGLTADVPRADVASALADLRAAARSDRPITDRVVRIRGGSRPATVDAWAALAVRGSIAFPAGTVSDLRPAQFTALLRGRALRFTASGTARRATTPKLKLVVEPAPRAALPPRSARTLEAAVAGYLRYARTRQFERYLANPDPLGRTGTTYLYETAAPPRTSVDAGRSSDDSGLSAALVVGLVLLVGFGLVVLWARS
jgi:hypothetical protein